LGDQSRAHSTSTGLTSLGAVDRSSREALDRPTAPSIVTRIRRIWSLDINRAGVKAGPRQGNS
jgi:hypothetical protein